MRNAVRGHPVFVAMWHDICGKAEADKATWISTLIEVGFKAAHPNDGWVDRKNLTLRFAYPQFNMGAGVGDLVMLGSHFDKPEKWRPVRLTSYMEGCITEGTFTFEDAPEALQENK